MCPNFVFVSLFKIFKTKPDPSELPAKGPLNTRPPSPPAYQPPPQVYAGGSVPPPPSLTHRPNFGSLIPPIAQAHISPPPSSPYMDGSSRQFSNMNLGPGMRNPLPQQQQQQQTQRVVYPSSPTTAELWSGTKPPQPSQPQPITISSSRYMY